MFPSQEEVNRLRERYPVGTKIVLDHMGNDPHPIPDGTKGTVRHVDDAGTVHCIFENGRYLGLIPGEDSFHVMKEKTLQEILASIDQITVVRAKSSTKRRERSYMRRPSSFWKVMGWSAQL